MMATSPLGRGLGSLIPSPAAKNDPASPVNQQDIHRLPLTRVRPNPRQPRSTIHHEGLEELITSVREHGILQPLVVMPKGKDYEIIAGERRFQAAKIVGLKTLPVIIREASEQEQLELALVENLQRQDLNPLEEAEAYQRLADEFNLTQELIARRVGKSRSYVANTLRLRSLPEEVKKAILNGAITEGHAKVILSLPTPEEQQKFLNSILAQSLTVRESESLAARGRTKTPRRSRSADPHLASQEEALQHALKTKVRIRQAGERGTIVIEFYSKEELAALFAQLTSKSE